jgi:hypothetical protein
VAAILNKSENATKVLIHRARTNLKKFLCKNCSLYHSTNFCQCKNLIGFSLKQDWIRVGSNQNGSGECVNASEIEDEVHHFRKFIDFYTQLNPPDAPQALDYRVRAMMESEDWEIFKNNGV